ncbi:hypothetical protein DPMN_109225 [Dreissena polymorpha]|uniref:Uncharacterized protein n=1 Tax=Dreissena polymorpha TaxID=45954 RepID=A0A9D4KAL6_DREPO|nr:hypothetical protein DPMN_109225 [Dreissena polymorpha]
MHRFLYLLPRPQIWCALLHLGNDDRHDKKGAKIYENQSAYVETDEKRDDDESVDEEEDENENVNMKMKTMKERDAVIVCDNNGVIVCKCRELR